MNKLFYTRFAANNIKKNGKTNIPFLITSILIVAMFYILLSLSQNEGLSDMKRGSRTLPIILGLGCCIVGIFAVIFLFYTYSFLMKRRQKEFGLFNILGMEKKHIAKIIALETLYMALISIVIGLFVGILLDKLMYMLVLRMTNVKSNLGFYVSFNPIWNTVIFFSGIFVLLFLYSMFKVRLTNPIQLLHGGQVGEKEPKTKILMTIIGLICLGIGYFLSIITKDSVDAVNFFFIAVIFVIIGTYLLFVAGSIALLKMLRKNKKYYYKTSHFISVSGMLYRMKKNAVGLANICILSTMVLVMISTTTTLMANIEEILNDRYSHDVLSVFTTNREKGEPLVSEIVQKTADKHKLTVSNITETNFLLRMTNYSNGKFAENIYVDGTAHLVEVISLSDYNRIENKNDSLKSDEILLFSEDTNICNDREITFYDKKYKVQNSENELISKFKFYYVSTAKNTIIIVSDDEFNSLDKQISDDVGYSSAVVYGYAFDLNGSNEQKTSFDKDYNNEIFNDEEICDNTAYFESKTDVKTGLYEIYGGLLFIGIFLGVLFVGAMILIIYYKQISEGYEDRERFDIMQKVGLSYAEAKKAIRSQILTVFFLPLITAGIHIIFASPMISKMLSLMMLSEKYMKDNMQIYIWCTVICFLVFAVLYAIIYMVTARTYYRIVKWENTLSK